MTEQHEKAYERIIHRVEKSLGKTEGVTLEELKRGIDQAMEFEEDVEELTRQEISLLGAYLKRDLKDLNRFMAQTGKGLAEWLKFDMTMLEDKLQSLLKQVADKTVIDQLQLEEELAEHAAEVYMSAEYVLAGTFLCANCKTEQEFTKPGFLMHCEQCGGEQFYRSNSD